MLQPPRGRDSLYHIPLQSFPGTSPHPPHPRVCVQTSVIGGGSQLNSDSLSSYPHLEDIAIIFLHPPGGGSAMGQDREREGEGQVGLGPQRMKER